MQKFEYIRLLHINGVVIGLNQQKLGEAKGTFTTTYKGPSVFEVVNNLGKDGWEMVSTSYMYNPGQNPTYEGEIWFKKPVS